MQPVGIAIECDAVMRMIGFDAPNQRLRMGCAHAVVDICAIGRAANRDDFCTQLVKDFRRDLVSRAMGRIDDDFQSFEREVAGKCAFGKFDVAACGIVQAAGFTQVFARCPNGRIQQGGFDSQLPTIGQLCAMGTEEFDAVVGIRIVAGRNHHAQARS